MNQNKNDLILQHLKNMISNHNHHFEESLAKFMLISLGVDFLKSIKSNGIYRSGLNTSTSLYGYIKMVFHESDTNPYPDTYYEKVKIKDYKKSTEEKIEINKKNLEVWTNLLNDISPLLTLDSSCFLSTWGKSEIISYSLWFALIKPIDWARNYINDPSKWKLNSVEEKILAISLSHHNHEFNLSEMSHHHQNEEISILLNVFLRHQGYIKENHLIDIKGTTNKDEDWIDKLFKSSGMKALIEQGDLKEVSQIFDEESLKILIKKTNLKKNVENHPEMLTNLLPIAPAEKWITACSFKNNFPINSFFDNKFIRGYGHSLTKKLKTLPSRHNKAQVAFEKEMSYLSDFLTKDYINSEDLINFWNNILKIGDLELFKTCAKHIGLPDEESKENNGFYDIYNTAKIEEFSFSGTKSFSLKELYLSERLIYSLKDKDEPTVRKIKI